MLIAVLLGMFAWTFAEYAVHRFLFHERRLGAAISGVHGMHHADVVRFAPIPHQLVIIGALLIPAGLCLQPFFGVNVWILEIAAVLSFLHGEWFHISSHRRPPRTAYGRWARRRHFQHHFMNTDKNFGITSPIWDLLLGTYEPVRDVVVMPYRFAARMSWLLDGDQIAAAYAGTYRLRSRQQSVPEGCTDHLPEELAELESA